MSISDDKKEVLVTVSPDVEQGEQVEVKESFFRKFINDWKPVYIAPLDPNMSRVERAIHGTVNLPFKKHLTNRHIQMIAIGGSLGAGLFVGTGNSLKNGGPAGLILGYFFVGFLVLCTMLALGELGVRYPVTGAFGAYNSRFVHMSWGFSIGVNYAIGWLLTLPTELIAAAVVIGYWDTDGTKAATVNKAAWTALFYCTIIFINIFGVRGYGEAEVIFSLIKVITVIGFIILGVILTCGGGPTHEYIGGRYWHNPGAFANGAKGVFKVFATAAYAYSGVEFTGLSAMETAHPQKALPKATKQVFWRILLFYILATAMVGCLVPWTDPRLGTSKDGSASPFVIAIKNAAIKGLPSVINVVIIIAVLSVGNSAVFGATRTLVSLAAQGHAPRFLLYIDRQGRPVIALIINMAFGLLGFVCATPNYSEGFTWLSTIAGLSGQLIYLSIMCCHIRHRMGMKAQGIPLSELEWKSPLGLWGSVAGSITSIVLLGLQFWVALFPLNNDGKASAVSFFQTWLSAAIILVVFVVHYAIYRDPWVANRDLDLHTGIRVTDKEELRREIQLEKEKLAAKPWIVRFYRFWC